MKCRRGGAVTKGFLGFRTWGSVERDQRTGGWGADGECKNEKKKDGELIVDKF